MSKSSHRLFGLFPVLLLAVIYSADGVSRDLKKEIDVYLRQRDLPAKFSGDVLVGHEGKIIFHKSYGMADYENDVPNSTDTVFRIGSLTKPITATAVMLLQQQSRLSVNDSIAKYIPAVPENWKRVKISHLLSHCSGIPDLFGDLEEVPVEDTVKEIERVVGKTEKRSLEFEPGSKYVYSNFNYCLLGYICEKISGQTLDVFLKTNIFDVLEMNHTLYDDPRPIIKKRAEGYVIKEGRLLNDKLTDPAGYAAGGLLSTTLDLFRFDRTLHSGKLLKPEALSAMFTPVRENYGYGWQITKQFNRKAIAHRGGTHGFSSYIVRYPDDNNFFLAVLSNVEAQSTRAVACDIADLYFNGSALGASYSNESQNLENYAGDYQVSTGETRTIQLKSGKLYYKSGNAEYRLRSRSAKEFVLDEAEEIRLKFVTTPAGKLEMIRSSCGQEEMRGIKITH